MNRAEIDTWMCCPGISMLECEDIPLGLSSGIDWDFKQEVRSHMQFRMKGRDHLKVLLKGSHHFTGSSEPHETLYTCQSLTSPWEDISIICFHLLHQELLILNSQVLEFYELSSKPPKIQTLRSLGQLCWLLPTLLFSDSLWISHPTPHSNHLPPFHTHPLPLLIPP